MEKYNFSILVVEDDSIAREVLEIIIGKYFKTVCTAVNGEKGLDMFKKHKPDLVITDLAMPVMDGFRFIEYLEEIDEDVKILVTTAYREEADRYSSHSVLYKPIDRTKLLVAIGEILGVDLIFSEQG
jgi:CheY-like chemotaxis protein